MGVIAKLKAAGFFNKGNLVILVYFSHGGLVSGKLHIAGAVDTETGNFIGNSLSWRGRTKRIAKEGSDQVHILDCCYADNAATPNVEVLAATSATEFAGGALENMLYKSAHQGAQGGQRANYLRFTVRWLGGQAEKVWAAILARSLWGDTNARTSPCKSPSEQTPPFPAAEGPTCRESSLRATFKNVLAQRILQRSNGGCSRISRAPSQASTLRWREFSGPTSSGPGFDTGEALGISAQDLRSQRCGTGELEERADGGG
ncbi:hypothetical protein K470DRAFT_277725 [Piedraia hortae CBS 480.64]|uniref:Uncharacterized protein n=1 Tax=Piedraia hortae CBS 480.64 TaxID=1314780 RepID=A0A6A7BXD6_9PEZI|nr:hypothetical protein K470DRAFT_277725 [Piedraia hortae CBS 480.64]